MTRRDFAVTAAFAPFAAGQSPPKPAFAYVGCFTTSQRKGRGDGIHVYRIDPGSGEWRQTQVLTGLANPSFLALGPGGRCLYSSHGDEDFATAYSIDAGSGAIKVMNRGATGGKNGAHLALSPNGRFMVVANYTSGTVAVLPVGADGGLADHMQLVTLEGAPGPHKTEQPGSHPHQIVFDPSGKFVLIPDKGLDRVFIFRFDEAVGRLTPATQGSVETRSGAGPRHLAFHPTQNIVWVLNELGNTVTTYAWDGAQGSLRALQTLPTLPEDYSGNSTAAEIAVGPGGRFLFTSNRGHDSIAAFAVNPKTGLLRSTGWTASGGKVPRFIAVEPSGRYLICANEQGDTMTRFTLNGATGALKATGTAIPNGTPVTIAFRV